MPIRRVVSNIKGKKYSFFTVFMGCFCLLHLAWVTYLLCNIQYWWNQDEDINAYMVVLLLMLAPIVVAVLLAIPPYIIYEKSKHKVWIYLCPCILTILLIWNTATRFGWTQYQEFIPAALTVGLYTLFIFAASHFSAPPERE